MAKSIGDVVGSWAFLIGVAIAVIVGAFSSVPLIANLNQEAVLWVLVVIGLVVGFLNVTARESNKFLMSGIVLILVSIFGLSIFSNPADSTKIIGNVLLTLLKIFIPAVIIVAIKNVFNIAKN